MYARVVDALENALQGSRKVQKRMTIGTAHS
jgi:hypothetical protein